MCGRNAALRGRAGLRRHGRVGNLLGRQVRLWLARHLQTTACHVTLKQLLFSKQALPCKASTAPLGDPETCSLTWRATSRLGERLEPSVPGGQAPSTCDHAAPVTFTAARSRWQPQIS